MACSCKKRIQFLHFLCISSFCFPLGNQLRRQCYILVTVGTNVWQILDQCAAGGFFVIRIVALWSSSDPAFWPNRIFFGHWPYMIDDRIQQNSNSIFVGSSNQCTQIFFGSKIRVYGRPIFGPIPMIAITFPCSFIGTSMNLLHNRCQPNGIDAQLRKVTFLDFLSNPFQISTLKTS